LKIKIDIKKDASLINLDKIRKIKTRLYSYITKLERAEEELNRYKNIQYGINTNFTSEGEHMDDNKLLFCLKYLNSLFSLSKDEEDNSILNFSQDNSVKYY
jgi:hypothetical protein